jgi:hypothetical protein
MNEGLLLLLLVGAYYLYSSSSGAAGGSGNFSALTVQLAQAIANAEGFNQAGSLAQTNNNPGDLTVDITGTGTGTDANGFVIYGSADDGWNALYTQVQEMLSGTSGIYSPTMTIAQVGQSYANGDSNWASNVAAYMGVATSTPLNQLPGFGS